MFFSFPSSSVAHTTCMHCLRKWQQRHTTYTWIHSPPFLLIPPGHAQWTTIELVSSPVMANLCHGGPDCMVWYGMLWGIVTVEYYAISQMMLFSMILSDPSRSRHCSTSNKSKGVKELYLQWQTNRKFVIWYHF